VVAYYDFDPPQPIENVGDVEIPPSSQQFAQQQDSQKEKQHTDTSTAHPPDGEVPIDAQS